MRKRELKVATMCTMSALLFLSSCVNDDYDLNEEIDMTIGVGGDLTLPVSSTAPLKMKDVLDLDGDDVVKVLHPDANGDGAYYLVKGSDNPGNFEFDLPDMEVKEPSIDPFKLSFTMPSQYELLKQAGLSEREMTLLFGGDTEKRLKYDVLEALIGKDRLEKPYTSEPVELQPEFHLLDQSFEMPEEVVGLKHISFAKPMRPDFYLSTTLPLGEVTMHQVIAEFPGEMEHDNVVSTGTWKGSLNENGRHEYRLPETFSLNSKSKEYLTMEFTGITFESKPWYLSEHPDRILALGEDVHMYGTVTINATVAQFLELAGGIYYVNADITMKAPDLSDVTVMVDPNVDAESTTVDLNDLPDFLTDNDVSIVLQQPMIFLDVDNNTPVEVNCWGNLITKAENGATYSNVKISEENTNGIQIGGNSDIDWCIYDGEMPEYAGYNLYRANGLCNILETIPHKIEINFDARVNQEWYTLTLGKRYSASVDYRMECPLAFGAGSQIVYSDTIDEWHADIEDYEVKTVVISATLTNDTPLDEVDLEVTAIDLNKNVIPAIKVTPLKKIKNGEHIEITLTCDEVGVMKNLDGIILKATARVTENDSAPLMSNSTIQLTDVRVGIKGGVIADLN